MAMRGSMVSLGDLQSKPSPAEGPTVLPDRRSTTGPEEHPGRPATYPRPAVAPKGSRYLIDGARRP